jgi:predicted ATPase
MGEQGENFAAVVGSILENEDLHRAYLSWLQQLTPTELDDVTILKGALGEPLFAIRENGQTIPAPVLSDGTLRFAAITAAFFQHSMPDIITIEEIENGIHPTRLRLLVELLKSQSADNGPQVFATTHSPVVLAWLDESDYETTFFCKRDEETGASIIKPLSEIPRLIELVKEQPLSELFTEGWMEAAF